MGGSESSDRMENKETVGASLDIRLAHLEHVWGMQEEHLKDFKKAFLDVFDNRNWELGDSSISVRDLKDYFFDKKEIKESLKKLGVDENNFEVFLQILGVSSSLPDFESYGDGGTKETSDKAGMFIVKGYSLPKFEWGAPRIEGGDWIKSYESMHGVIAAFKKIMTDKKLVDLITPETAFRHRGGARIEFTVKTEFGDEKTYVATPDAVLLLIKQGTEKQFKDWVDARKEYIDKKSSFLGRLEVESVPGDVAGLLMKYAQNRILTSEEKASLPKDYVSEAREVKRAFRGLMEKQIEYGDKFLYDEKKGTPVKEYNIDPYLSDQFLRVYSDEATGRDSKQVYYKSTRLVDKSHKTPLSYRKFAYVEHEFDPRNRHPLRSVYHSDFGYSKERVETVEARIDGRDVPVKEFHYNWEGKLELEVDYYPSGSVKKYKYYSGNAETMVVDVEEGTKVPSSVTMFTKDGEQVGLYDEKNEEAKDDKKQMTKKQYVEHLAKVLKTPEDIDRYINTFMTYVYDYSPEREDDFEDKGRGGNDYWQSSGETLSRVERQTMLGDCDDFAFLARDILRAQGKNAHVVSVVTTSGQALGGGGGHAICVWFEKRPDGRVDSYSLGTFGLDKNGEQNPFSYGEEKKKSVQNGFLDIRSGFEALLPKYGKGSHYMQEDIGRSNVYILDVPGKSDFNSPSAVYDHYAQRVMPLSIFENREKYEKFMRRLKDMDRVSDEEKKYMRIQHNLSEN